MMNEYSLNNSASHRILISLRMVWGFTFDPRTPKMAKFLNSQASPSTQHTIASTGARFTESEGTVGKNAWSEVIQNLKMFANATMSKLWVT